MLPPGLRHHQNVNAYALDVNSDLIAFAMLTFVLDRVRPTAFPARRSPVRSSCFLSPRAPRARSLVKVPAPPWVLSSSPGRGWGWPGWGSPPAGPGQTPHLRCAVRPHCRQPHLLRRHLLQAPCPPAPPAAVPKRTESTRPSTLWPTCPSRPPTRPQVSPTGLAATDPRDSRPLMQAVDQAQVNH